MKQYFYHMRKDEGLGESQELDFNTDIAGCVILANCNICSHLLPYLSNSNTNIYLRDSLKT